MSTVEELPAAPVAGVEPVVLDLHGVRRVDDYAWLQDRQRPQTRAYLAAERGYYDAHMLHTHALRAALFDDMSRRVASTDRSVSWSRGGCVYYTRVVAGKEYPQFLRDCVGNFTEQMLLDENLVAGDSVYFALGVREVSPDGRLLAYSFDRDGDETFTLRFRDLGTAEDLPDLVPRSYYGGAWSADSSTFFYVVHDDASRPFQVWRHSVGGGDIDSGRRDDELVLEEADEAFELFVEASRSGGYVVIHSVSTDTSQAWLIPTSDPTAAPVSVQPRRRGVLYRVTHAPEVRGQGDGDAGPEADSDQDSDVLLIVTNDEAREFRLVSAPVSTPGREYWTEIIPQNPNERLVAADAFAGYVVLTLRRDGSVFLRVHSRGKGGRWSLEHEVHPQIPAGTIQLGPNENYLDESVIVAIDSYTAPTAWYAVRLATGERALLKRRDVPGYDASAYVSQVIEVPAADGARIPVTVVRRADTPLDGTAACLIYGYGAYEACDEPTFDEALSVLLDHGVVFAHAHARGGGERGRQWWLDGRLSRKQNTFSDFVAVADSLAESMVDPARIVARGLSAGGLLMGAVYAQAPWRWRGIVAEVPFVDVVTTMLDESVPLTAQEYGEWGDPRRADDFAWMTAYSPYDNVPAVADRPRLLVTAALHDARVMYWEPAKWVAKLRATGSTDDSVLLRAELGACAHSGPHGRFAHLAYESEVYAWVLDSIARSDGRQRNASS